MVVPVLMISRHVSLKLKRGPLAAQIKTIATHIPKVHGRPASLAVALENLTKSISISLQRALPKRARWFEAVRRPGRNCSPK